MLKLERLYTDEFCYTLPRSTIEGYLRGVAFNNEEPYTPEERERLEADIQEIWANILERNPPKEKVALITAGAPGAGKTIQLRKLLGNTAYICPDDVCLKQQVRTYVPEGQRDLRNAYTKWRPGSNAAAHLILANLIREGYAFSFGTTSTGSNAPKLFQLLHDQGYRIKLIHVIAPDTVRWASILKRDESFVQTTESDTRMKGRIAPQRIKDTFLHYADEIDFYYRNGRDSDAILVATWIKDGKLLEIKDRRHYNLMKAIHNTAVDTLEMPELRWEHAVESFSSKA